MIFLVLKKSTFRVARVSLTSESTLNGHIMETHRTKVRKEDGTHLMKCIRMISLIFRTDYYRTHCVGYSYTVLCLLSRLYPIASEEWGGKSINIPSESESADSSTCPIMVSGLDDSLGGVEDAPLLRSVIVVVASVPWRAPEEWRGRMDGDKRGKPMALAPACKIPVNERVYWINMDYYI